MILWVIFAVNVLGTIIKRKEEQMYISLWYIIATVIAVAVLYIVNNLAVPAGLFKSYSVFAGINSANVQWCYGHNVVGFIFTTPMLAMFYYFLPKSTGLPIFSHRLSIVAFWSLVFAYLWTGAHHLVYTPLPDWLPGHVHMGTMGWVTMTVTASIYYIIPRIYNTGIHSVKVANTHFYLVLTGQLIFSVTMWITGIQQGALWKAVNPDGTLRYIFMEGLVKNYPFWQMRTIGGLIFTAGMLFFIYNIFMTMRKGNALAGSKA